MSPEVGKLLATQAVSVAGIALLVAICWLLGFRQRARIETEAQVLELTQEEALRLPNAIAIDVEGRTALAEIDAETVFLVKSVGDRLMTRTFRRSAVAGVKMYRPRGKGIGARIRFSDLGLDDVRIEFAEREAPAFIERLRRGARFK